MAKDDMGSSPNGSTGAALGALGLWAMRLTEEGKEDAAKALVQRAMGVVLGRA